MLKFISFLAILFAVVIIEGQSRPQVLTTYPGVITLPLQTPQGSASFYPIDKLRNRRDTKPKPSSDSSSDEKNVKPTTPKMDTASHPNPPAALPGNPTKATDGQHSVSPPPKAAPPTSGLSGTPQPPAVAAAATTSKPAGTADKPVASSPTNISPPVGAASVASPGEKTIGSDIAATTPKVVPTTTAAHKE
ncbi:hypothetical protein PVAND_016383 [Polypedilum vanderplanki]|uniref:Uncharacterized protein n=1 Tax=Polypedilum vanderplanki TaxID=319348 RepID=A0A9J6BG24_POLVA|nr:hypothetical protein PVAND_016383 [Polypedilum vanderplanki]